eukprot:tig00020610_g12039.t1
MQLDVGGAPGGAGAAVRGLLAKLQMALAAGAAGKMAGLWSSEAAQLARTERAAQEGVENEIGSLRTRVDELSFELRQAREDLHFYSDLREQLQSAAPQLSTLVEMVVSKERNILSDRSAKRKHVSSRASLTVPPLAGAQDFETRNMRVLEILGHRDAEIRRLQGELARSRAETEALQGRMEQVVDECQRERAARGEAEERLARMLAEQFQTEGQRDLVQRLQESAERAVRKAAEAEGRAEERARELHKERAARESLIREAETRVATAARASEEAKDRRILQLEEAIAQLRTDASRQRHMEGEAGLGSITWQRRWEEADEARRDAQVALHEAERAFAQEIARLRAAYDSVSAAPKARGGPAAQAAAQTATTKQLRSRVLDLEAQVSTLRASLSRAEQDLTRAASKELIRKEMQVGSLERQLRSSRDGTLQEAYARDMEVMRHAEMLDEEASAARQHAAQQEAEARRLGEELARCRAELAERDRRLEGVTALEARLGAQEGAAAALEKQYAGMLQSREERLAALEGEVAKMEAALRAAREGRDGKLASLARAVEILSTKGDLHAEVARLVNENAGLAERVREAEAALASSTGTRGRPRSASPGASPRRGSAAAVNAAAEAARAAAAVVRENEVVALRSKVTELTGEVGRLEGLLRAARDEMVRRAEAGRAMQEAAASATGAQYAAALHEERVIELQKQVLLREAEVSRLTEERASLATRLRQSEVAAVEAEGRAERVRVQLVEAERVIHQTRDAHQVVQVQLAARHAEDLAKFQKAAAEATRRADAAAAERAEAVAAREEAAAAEARATARLQRAEAEAEEKARLAAGEAAGLRLTAQTLARDVERLNAGIRERDSRIALLTETLEGLQAGGGHIAERAVALAKELSARRSAGHGLQQRVDDMAAALERAEEKAGRLQRELDAVRQRQRAAEAQAAALQSQELKLQQQARAAAAELRARDHTLLDAQRSAREASERAARLEAQVGALQAQLHEQRQRHFEQLARDRAEADAAVLKAATEAAAAAAAQGFAAQQTQQTAERDEADRAGQPGSPAGSSSSGAAAAQAQTALERARGALLEAEAGRQREASGRFAAQVVADRYAARLRALEAALDARTAEWEVGLFVQQKLAEHVEELAAIKDKAESRPARPARFLALACPPRPLNPGQVCALEATNVRLAMDNRDLAEQAAGLQRAAALRDSQLAVEMAEARVSAAADRNHAWERAVRSLAAEIEGEVLMALREPEEREAVAALTRQLTAQKALHAEAVQELEAAQRKQDVLRVHNINLKEIIQSLEARLRALQTQQHQHGGGAQHAPAPGTAAATEAVAAEERAGGGGGGAAAAWARRSRPFGCWRSCGRRSGRRRRRAQR